ncbi:unnamed protein product [Paramecium sonneborni]|uniref:Uncharacterized protein n=1 Tax=Paramecium sonneborni TaxID=65129 RepID=A0A8S1M6S3_9CILI|nr:unnamed protein product [Paramecium sonneborni]
MFGNTLAANNTQTQQQINSAPSIFGTSNNLFSQQSNLFGQQQQPQGIVGQPQQQNIFANNTQSNQPQQQTNILGQQQQSNPLLGQVQQQTITQLGQTQTSNIFGQQNQQQQQQPQTQTQITQQSTLQQPAQPKVHTMNQINQQTKLLIENMAKTIANKEKIDKNQKNLQLIEKNSLKNIQQQQQQQLTIGINQTQQQISRTLLKGDRRNHTQKAENYYNEWNKLYLSINKKQDETLTQLTAIIDQLTQQDTVYDIDDESLIDSIQQLGKELDDLERKIYSVVQTQQKVLGLEKEESEWDQIVNNLSECLLHLDLQTKEVEDLLLQAEKNPKVQNK